MFKDRISCTQFLGELRKITQDTSFLQHLSHRTRLLYIAFPDQRGQHRLGADLISAYIPSRECVLNVSMEQPYGKPQPGYCRVNAKLPSTGREERAQAHKACTKLLLLAWLVTSGCTSNSLVGLTENCNGKALEDEHNGPISQTILFTIALSCNSKLWKTAETA